MKLAQEPTVVPVISETAAATVAVEVTAVVEVAIAIAIDAPAGTTASPGGNEVRTPTSRGSDRLIPCGISPTARKGSKGERQESEGASAPIQTLAFFVSKMPVSRRSTTYFLAAGVILSVNR